jgi:lambda family phage tail tape measure protein
MNELSAETARAMQSNFSTFFFDGMTGEFKSLNDYATAMFRSIQKAAADMAGQFLTQKLFGTQSTGGTAGGGGWLQQMGSWIGTLFQSGSTATAANGLAFDRSGMVAFARGGVVDRPTVFPFARGVGLMGEAGPEAIMPLRRDASGRLGISAGGQSTNNVTINVAAPGGRMDRESLNHLQTALFASLQRAGQRNS